MAWGLFLNYSCVPVGNHISSLCGEYRLLTRIGGQVTCREIRCVLLTAAALVTADSDEITPLTLKFACVCIFGSHSFFVCFFLLKTSHHFFFLFSFLQPSFCHAEFIHQHFFWVMWVGRQEHSLFLSFLVQKRNQNKEGRNGLGVESVRVFFFFAEVEIKNVNSGTFLRDESINYTCEVTSRGWIEAAEVYSLSPS